MAFINSGEDGGRRRAEGVGTWNEESSNDTQHLHSRLRRASPPAHPLLPRRRSEDVRESARAHGRASESVLQRSVGDVDDGDVSDESEDMSVAQAYVGAAVEGAEVKYVSGLGHGVLAWGRGGGGGMRKMTIRRAVMMWVDGLCRGREVI